MKSGKTLRLPEDTKGQKLYVQAGDKYDWQVRSENTIYAFFDTEEDAKIYLKRICEHR